MLLKSRDSGKVATIENKYMCRLNQENGGVWSVQPSPQEKLTRKVVSLIRCSLIVRYNRCL